MPKCKKHPEVDLQIGQTVKGMSYVYCPDCKKAKGEKPSDGEQKTKGKKARPAARQSQPAAAATAEPSRTENQPGKPKPESGRGWGSVGRIFH